MFVLAAQFSSVVKLVCSILAVERPTDIGILCLNSATIFAIKRAVINGEPLISRVTTVTGGACTINRN
ncbi:hypothetical protein N9W75_01810, partial [Porticoccaceae bacterium]|nr:hypothetical protein [Porticoccaceae bacterium]